MDSTKPLPTLPAKRYFTIGEVSDLCSVKAHVLRYWEQEFTQLRPMKRRGNRRYYQHHEVLMIRCIRDLLYDQGFTISGARNKLLELDQTQSSKHTNQDLIQGLLALNSHEKAEQYLFEENLSSEVASLQCAQIIPTDASLILSTEAHRLELLRQELLEIRNLLSIHG
jgi:DNA-binding transcriptional MerR regulator